MHRKKVGEDLLHQLKNVVLKKANYFNSKKIVLEQEVFNLIKLFFKAYLELDYELSFSELRNKVEKLSLDDALYDELIDFISTLSSSIYSGKQFSQEELHSVIENFKVIVNNLIEKEEKKTLVEESVKHVLRFSFIRNLFIRKKNFKSSDLQKREENNNFIRKKLIDKIKKFPDLNLSLVSVDKKEEEHALSKKKLKDHSKKKSKKTIKKSKKKDSSTKLKDSILNVSESKSIESDSLSVETKKSKKPKISSQSKSGSKIKNNSIKINNKQNNVETNKKVKNKDLPEEVKSNFTQINKSSESKPETKNKHSKKNVLTEESSFDFTKDPNENGLDNDLKKNKINIQESKIKKLKSKEKLNIDKEKKEVNDKIILKKESSKPNKKQKSKVSDKQDNISKEFNKNSSFNFVQKNEIEKAEPSFLFNTSKDKHASTEDKMIFIEDKPNEEKKLIEDDSKFTDFLNIEQRVSKLNDKLSEIKNKNKHIILNKLPLIEKENLSVKTLIDNKKNLKNKSVLLDEVKKIDETIQRHKAELNFLQKKSKLNDELQSKNLLKTSKSKNEFKLFNFKDQLNSENLNDSFVKLIKESDRYLKIKNKKNHDSTLSNRIPFYLKFNHILDLLFSEINQKKLIKAKQHYKQLLSIYVSLNNDERELLYKDLKEVYNLIIKKEKEAKK
jgi:hypothetical protein